MDFKSTEAAEDLGGLVRTITEAVCTPEHQRELDGLELGALLAAGAHLAGDGSTATCGAS